MGREGVGVTSALPKRDLICAACNYAYSDDSICKCGRKVRMCLIPSGCVGACELERGHEGDMHSNGGDGFYSREWDDEHKYRQSEHIGWANMRKRDRAEGKAEGFAEGVEAAIRIAHTMPWCKECLATDQMIDELEKLVPKAEATASEPPECLRSLSDEELAKVKTPTAEEIEEALAKGYAERRAFETGRPVSEFLQKDNDRGPEPGPGTDAFTCKECGYNRYPGTPCLTCKQIASDTWKARIEQTDREAHQREVNCDRMRADRDDWAERAKEAERERDELRIAVTRAMGAFVDVGTVIVPDEPKQIEDAIKALAAQRDELAETLRTIASSQEHNGATKVHRIARAALAKLGGGA